MISEHEIGMTPQSVIELYTLKQSLQRLRHIKRSTFYRRVKEGQIRAVIPAGEKHQKYVKEDVERLAREMEIFHQTYTIEREL